jgi:hypothetical protein
MKKLIWKKKQYDGLIIWMADVKPVGWQFSIEQIEKQKYQAFIYYGSGEDQPLLRSDIYLTSLQEAKEICNNWLHNTILGLNKWI